MAHPADHSTDAAAPMLGLLAFCSCSVGFSEDMEAVSYSVGAESFVTAPAPLTAGTVLSWYTQSMVFCMCGKRPDLFITPRPEPSCVEIPALASSSRSSIIRSLSLKVSLYLRSKLPCVAGSGDEEAVRSYRLGDKVCGLRALHRAPSLT